MIVCIRLSVKFWNHKDPDEPPGFSPDLSCSRGIWKPFFSVLRRGRVWRLHKRRLWAALPEPARRVQLQLQGRVRSAGGRPHQVPAWVGRRVRRAWSRLMTVWLQHPSWFTNVCSSRVRPPLSERRLCRPKYLRVSSGVSSLRLLRYHLPPWRSRELKMFLLCRKIHRSVFGDI